ncbi:hypothetical protein ACA910_005584 [Epithemia clementina (nom. ined.)]
MKRGIVVALIVSLLLDLVVWPYSTTASTLDSGDQVGEGEQQDERKLRNARFMPLSLFKTLFYTSLSLDSSDPTDEEKANWAAYTEWGWKRSIAVEQNQSSPFPFIVCDDDNNPSAVDRKKSVAFNAIGVDEGVDLSEFFVTIKNTPEMTCYMGLVNGTQAEELGDFYVQPVTFLLKINAATVSFTGVGSDALIQYSVWFCPAVRQRNWTEWSFEIFDEIVPLIPVLVQFPEAEAYSDNFMRLYDYLQYTDREFCNDLLLENVEVENLEEYFIVTFNTTREPRSDGIPDEAPETCFVLWAFALAYAPEICYIERREPFETSNVIEQWIGQSGIPDYTPFYDHNITGEGQLVAVSDTGLDLDNCYFRDDAPMPFGTSFDLTRRKVVQYVDHVNSGESVNGHGTHVCGTIAGRKSEDGVTSTDGFVDGVAKGARLCFFDIGRDDENESLSVPGADRLLNPGKLAGARLHSASWGSASNFYANQDRDFDRYIYNDESFLVIIAAGNAGPDPKSVGSPANAKNVLTVGASTSGPGSISRGVTPVDQLAGFSSVGPSMDQRIKPDVVGPGAWVLSTGARDFPSCDPPSAADLPGPGGSNPAYGILSLQGTSMATPVVAGHCALLRQYFIEGWHGNGTKGSAESLDPSGTLVKATIINGAQSLGEFGLNDVNFEQGFGRISLIDSVPLFEENDLSAAFLDQVPIAQNQTISYNFTLRSRNKTCEDAELSATLVWADPPGFVGCLNCVLNDLDLYVEQTTVDGNVTQHFPNGKTVKDSVNNVERARFKAADGDSFIIQVTAAQLESEEQTYSLAVVYGCLNHRARAGLSTSGAGGPFMPNSVFGWWLVVGAATTAALTHLLLWL